MMTLTLIPQWGRDESVLSVSGDVLAFEGTAYDLSAIPEGGEATPEGDHPFIGTITREGGAIHATVLVGVGADAAVDQPGAPWTIPNASGPVAIPAVRIEQEDEE